MDELRTAISMYVDLPIGSAPSSSGKAAKGKGKGSPKKAAAPSSSSTESPAYDRWNLLDDATIDYGHVAKTGGVGIDKADGGYYITTAINYTNGPAHMGHAYEAATSDVIARFQRLKGGQPVYFVTGADEHGQKIANTAADKGKQPIEICNQVRFRTIVEDIMGFVRQTESKTPQIFSNFCKFSSHCRCRDYDATVREWIQVLESKDFDFKR